MKRCMLLYGLILLVLPVVALAGPGESVSACKIRKAPTTWRLRVNFDQSLSFKTYADDVEHKTENWVLLKDAVSLEDFDIAGSIERDTEDNLTDELVGYEVTIHNFDQFANYEIKPSEALVQKYENVDPQPDFLKEVTLWQADDPFAKTKKLDQAIYRIFKGRYLTIDIQPVSDSNDDAAVNIDYTLKFDYRLGNVESSGERGWQGADLKFTSDGKKIMWPKDDDETKLGTISTALSLKGNWTYWKPEADEFDYTMSSSEERQQAKREGVFDPTDIYLDIHLAHEAVQDFGDQQLTVGTALTATYPFPRVMNGIPLPLMPLAPVLLINRSELATVPQPWFVFSADFVFVDESERMKFSEDDEFERIMLEIAWTSEVVFPNTWLYASFTGWWEIDPPPEVEDAGQDFENYWEIGLKLPLIQREKKDGTFSWFVVKYQDGALPPSFSEDTQVKAGFTFEY